MHTLRILDIFIQTQLEMIQLSTIWTWIDSVLDFCRLQAETDVKLLNVSEYGCCN